MVGREHHLNLQRVKAAAKTRSVKASRLPQRNVQYKAGLSDLVASGRYSFRSTTPDLSPYTARARGSSAQSPKKQARMYFMATSRPTILVNEPAQRDFSMTPNLYRRFRCGRMVRPIFEKQNHPDFNARE
jgi:hypothetical protein